MIGPYRGATPTITLSIGIASDAARGRISHVHRRTTNDLVTDALQIAGVAGGAFEATFNYRIHEGHDEVTGFFTAGDGAGGHGQFQLIVDVSGAAFQPDRVFLAVWARSA